MMRDISHERFLCVEGKQIFWTCLPAPTRRPARPRSYRFILDPAGTGGRPRERGTVSHYPTRCLCDLLSLWGGFLYVYFGTPLPGTMLAKQAQLVLGHWETFTVMLALEKLWARIPGVIPVILVAGIVCWFVEWGRRCYQKGEIATTESSPTPLGAATLLYCLFPPILLIAYEAFGVTFWGWYIVPVYYALLLTHDPKPEDCTCCCGSSCSPQDGTGRCSSPG